MYRSFWAHGVPSLLFPQLSNPQRNVLATALVIAALTSAHAQEPDWNKGGPLNISHSIDSGQDITLQNQLTLNVSPGENVSLRGNIGAAITSPGLFALTKDGEGGLELWGNNTALEKPVMLREGTLHLAGRHALGPDAHAHLHVYAGTTLSYEAGATIAAQLQLYDTVSGTPGHGQDPTAIQWRVDRGIAKQIADIHGATPLIKQGAGTLQLSAPSNDPRGRLTIAEGTVQLENQFSGHINVLDAATLSGHGTTGGLTVGSGGNLMPTGRLNVGNALHFQPGSHLHIRTWADGQHDSVHVLYGVAELDGHVLVLPQGGPEHWQQGIDAVIVHTRDGLGTSRFASVESALPYLEPELSYDSYSVTLHLRPRTNGSITLPKNQRTNWAASVRSIISDDSRFIRDAVYTHGAARSGFWSHAFHSSGERRAQGKANGDERRINGVLLGANMELTPAWRLGIYAGGSNTHANQHDTPNATMGHKATPVADPHANASIDSAHLGLLAHHTTAWDSQLTAGFAHSWHHIRNRRTAVNSVFHDALSSRYRARTSQIFGKIQHPLWTSFDQHTTIEPFAGMAWVHTQQDGHTERGGTLALQSPSDRTAVLYSSIGSTVNHRLTLAQGSATLTGSVAWRHASGDTHSSMRQHFRDDVHRTSLTSYGLPVTRQAWQLRLGVQAEISKQAQLGMHYAGQHGHGYHDHGVQVGLAVRW